MKDISGRVRMFNASSGREGLFLNLRANALKRREEPPILFEVGVDGARNQMGIKTITVRVVKLLVAGVVNDQCIRVRRAANDNTVHQMSLILGAGDLTIFIVMKIANGEEGHPRPTVRKGAINQEEGRGKFAFEAAGNHINHPSRVED